MISWVVLTSPFKSDTTKQRGKSILFVTITEMENLTGEFLSHPLDRRVLMALQDRRGRMNMTRPLKRVHSLPSSFESSR